MTLLNIIALLSGCVLVAFFVLFTLASTREQKGRAAGISATIALILATLTTYVVVESHSAIGKAAFVAIVGLGIALFYFRTGKPETMNAGKITARVDERTTMFAREEYEPGTEKYEQYYRMHPEHEEIDARIRQLPPLLAPGGRYYTPEKSASIKATFRTIKEMTTQVDGEINPDRSERTPEQFTAEIKDLVMRLGASDVGMCELNPAYVYSHVGRGPEPWGKPIELNHKYAIAFTLEMDYNRVEQAPDIPITEEAGAQYLKMAMISVNVARYIRHLGYPARAHISDSNYQVMLPPIAVDAGLGELSRMGYLISSKLGPRVRLGAITTDLPLTPDSPRTFGVQDFCRICLKCVRNCPSAAIPAGEKITVRGVDKWQLDVEKCLWFWRVAGTDCGLCMRVCPYSHPPTFVHRIVRAGIKRSAVARQLSVWGDDIMYGRKIPLPPSRAPKTNEPFAV